MQFAPQFFGGDGTGASAAEIIAAFKADAELGTASGGLVANAAQVLNVPRSSGAMAAGAQTVETRSVLIDTEAELVETRTIN